MPVNWEEFGAISIQHSLVPIHWETDYYTLKILHFPFQSSFQRKEYWRLSRACGWNSYHSSRQCFLGKTLKTFLKGVVGFYFYSRLPSEGQHLKMEHKIIQTRFFYNEQGGISYKQSLPSFFPVSQSSAQSKLGLTSNISFIIFRADDGSHEFVTMTNITVESGTLILISSGDRKSSRRLSVPKAFVIQFWTFEEREHFSSCLQESSELAVKEDIVTKVALQPNPGQTYVWKQWCNSV